MGHSWIKKHSTQPIIDLSSEYKVSILNRIAKYSKTSDFYKMIVSLAIGIKVYQDTDEEKKLENFFYTFDDNPDGCLTSIEFLNAIRELELSNIDSL